MDARGRIRLYHRGNGADNLGHMGYEKEEMKKYELTSETKIFFGHILYRIKALSSFGCVSAGDLGGFLESEKNLSQNGDAWVYGDAGVYGNAMVFGDARVSGNAWVYGNARVFGDAEVSEIGAIFWIGAIGSRNDTATFFRCRDGSIKVVCGCFFGNLDEFAKKVRKTHGDNDHAKVYMLAIDMAKIRISTEKEKTEE